MGNRPDFIIIGAMKCATSTLHEQLALQPGIFMTDLKEPNFFSDDDQYDRGLEYYLSLFAAAKADDLCGESSTHYTKLLTHPKTIARLHQFLPDVKLIYVMRHPIDRLISQYIHQWTECEISVEIDPALDKHPELIDYSLYARQLQPYFDTFGRQRVLPVFFERLLRHPQAELERVCQFIGYDRQPIWDSELNAQNVSSERLRKSLWRDLLVEAPMLKTIRQQLVPKSWREQIKSLWTMKQRPQIDSQRLTALQQVFDRDLAVLGSWLGVELSCDNFKALVSSAAIDWTDS
ncbi:MAG: sulfotransferase [Cyanosarcina radialis HA8281-LM2]|nr:sulfotransferase [Cyanosarcina radialis HA8281-LM2]